MYENNKLKSKWITGGVTILGITLLGGAFLLGYNSQAARPLQSEGLSSLASAAAKSSSPLADDVSYYISDGHYLSPVGADASAKVTRARLVDGKWEYSTDNGKTWTDIPPEGVKTNENGSMTVWQGQGDANDFDIDAWEQEIDRWLESILRELNYGDGITSEGYGDENAYFSFGDTIARQTDDGKWQYSTDGGKTWTNEAPDGISVNGDDNGFTFGNGDFDFDSFWRKLWPEHLDNTNQGTAAGV